MSTFGAERVSVASSTPRVVTLGLLQGFRLERDGEKFQLPLGIQRLVAFLAVHNRPLLRLFVAGNLWIDSSEEHANANLRTALWRLHRLGFDLVDATRNHLALAPEVVVDLHDLSGRARQVLRHEVAPTRDNVDAILTGGDLLAGLVRRLGPGRAGAIPPAATARARDVVQRSRGGGLVPGCGRSGVSRASPPSRCARAHTAR